MLVLLASALALAAAEGARADSLQVAPNKTQKFQKSQQAPVYQTYGTLHGRDFQQNVIASPGTDNRYYSDTLSSTSIQGSAFLANGGGWTALPCTTDVWGCF